MPSGSGTDGSVGGGCLWPLLNDVQLDAGVYATLTERARASRYQEGIGVRLERWD